MGPDVSAIRAQPVLNSDNHSDPRIASMKMLPKRSYCLTLMLPKSGRCLMMMLPKSWRHGYGLKIGTATRTEVLEAVRGRYREASRGDKTRMLDEFVAMVGCHRKHAVRLLGQQERSTGHSVLRGRRIYDEAVRQALIVVWEASDRICGKRLKAALPSMVESLERHGHLDLDPGVRERLFSASASTMDRLLRPVRAGRQPQEAQEEEEDGKPGPDPHLHGLERTEPGLSRDRPRGPRWLEGVSARASPGGGPRTQSPERKRASIPRPERMVEAAPAFGLSPSEKRTLDLVTDHPMIPRGYLALWLGVSEGRVDPRQLFCPPVASPENVTELSGGF